MVVWIGICSCAEYLYNVRGPTFIVSGEAAFEAPGLVAVLRLLPYWSRITGQFVGWKIKTLWNYFKGYPTMQENNKLLNLPWVEPTRSYATTLLFKFSIRFSGFNPTGVSKHYWSVSEFLQNRNIICCPLCDWPFWSIFTSIIYKYK